MPLRQRPQGCPLKGSRFIESIRLDSILSFGPHALDDLDTPDLSLEPLNVLIGPNASGKSNFIAALSLLSAAPRDLQVLFREGGDSRHWPWNGGWSPISPTLEVKVDLPATISRVKYSLSFDDTGLGFELRDEVIELPKEERLGWSHEPTLYRYRGADGSAVARPHGSDGGLIDSKQQLHPVEVAPDQSVLSQLRDPETYPALTGLADLFEGMSFYRDLPAGRHAPARLPQPTDLEHDRLLEDASNLGVVLSDLQNMPEVKKLLLERMRIFYPAIEDVVTNVSGGAVQVFFHEERLMDAVPATRVSDGSLRYLCLLVALCSPRRSWIICIEEPEIGLHPDMLPEVAKLLVEATEHSQIFVTTHSDILVDALTDIPEAVIVCEKENGATKLRRLDAGQLEPWLERYRLGELWTRGEIGGNRW